MTWIKLDDRAPRHPKLASLTDRAFRWWILGLCYASEFLTNGVLHPVFWKRTPPSARKELSTGKLWDWEDPNFVIHDYLEHQTSRESVEKERRRNRERRRSDRRDDAGSTSGTTDGTPAGTPEDLPPPENREQRTDTEDLKTTHTARERVTGQTNGANHPGSLPRDHRFHVVCGARYRVCLSEKTAADLVADWGGDPSDALIALKRFCDELEAEIGDGPKGNHLWLLQHFDAFKGRNGRVPAPVVNVARVAKDAAVAAEIDAWGSND